MHGWLIRSLVYVFVRNLHLFHTQPTVIKTTWVNLYPSIFEVHYVDKRNENRIESLLAIVTYKGPGSVMVSQINALKLDHSFLCQFR